MKKGSLCIKLISILVALLAINGLIRVRFDPSPYYGNDTVEQKMAEYSPNPEQFNTMLIGSSCIFWNLDPIIFESQLPLSWHVRSYNFGSGGSLPPESYYMLDQLLSTHGTHISTVIIELRDIGIFQEHQRNTLRMRYWLSPFRYGFVVRTSMASRIPGRLRFQNIRFYGASLMERLFNINYLSDIFSKNSEDQALYDERLINLTQNARRGFLPIDAEKEQDRRADFLKDTTFLPKSIALYNEAQKRENKLPVNHVHLAKILSIIDHCNRAGIHCAFLAHPKQNLHQFHEFIALTQHIPENHLINLTDPELFPELYQAQYSLNNSHYNIQGTQILSTLAAQQFKRIHGQWLEEVESRK